METIFDVYRNGRVLVFTGMEGVFGVYRNGKGVW